MLTEHVGIIARFAGGKLNILMVINRAWAMPNSNTFEVKPIGDFVKRYLESSKYSVDPFARNNEFASVRNDLNTTTSATHHLDALDFLKWVKEQGKLFDLGIFDPPYSPRQISEVYQQIGRKATSQDTSKSWGSWRDALSVVIQENGIVLSFGWNSCGMGMKRGFEIVEILMVCHGGNHNDTICVAEVKSNPLLR